MTFPHVLLLPPARDDGVLLGDGLVDAGQADRPYGVRPDRVLGQPDEGDVCSEVGVTRIVIIVWMGENVFNLKTA